MGQIPSLRVAVGLPAFSNTAMDMFGPLQIRMNRKTLKEAQVIIFTCMSTSRAVHLELVTDRSTDTFLMAFRRLACLRGHPSTCWSDRGTNFVGAQGYLREIMHDWDVTRIQKVLVEDFSCNFKWKWNIPYASHQNGVVESLIKSVRQALNATCKNQAFTEEQWRTYLTEITYMINGRPLYPSSENIWESPPITPNDILIGQHNQPPQPDPEDKVNPRNMLRSTQNRVNEFWNCWMKYFAPNLLPRNKWFRIRENVQVGDLVLELDPNHKRSQWKMALIVGTYPGSDGLVRKVRIKTKNGGEYDRPIHKLCLITTNQELNGGYVNYAWMDSQEQVAVKIIDKKQAMEDRYVSKNMRREAKILQMVRHPNVIQLLEVVETENRGVNMYAMLTGKLPYTAEPFNIITLYNKMVKGDMNPIPDRLSPGCKDLMLRFLTFDPKERISIDEAIQHPWLRKGFDDPLVHLTFPHYLKSDELNSDILNHMCDRMQFKTKDVVEGVTNNKSNAASCVYHLINRKLQRYLDKHPNTRMLRRSKSKDDETDAVTKKQRIDDTDSSNRMLVGSRTGSITSQALQFGSGAGSSQGSRGIKEGSAASSQGSRGPRGRLGSDRDGTELQGSVTIPTASDHYLALPADNVVNKSSAFTQLSIEIEDDDIPGDDADRRDVVEGHDPANRKVSQTHDYLAERNMSKTEYIPSTLTFENHPPVFIIDDVTNDNNNININGQKQTGHSSLENDVFIEPMNNNNGVTNTPMDDGIDSSDVTDGSHAAKDSGMAPTMGPVVAKVVSVPLSLTLKSLMQPDGQTAVDPHRKSSLPTTLSRVSTDSINQENDQSHYATRSRRGSLPSRTYHVTRDPSPIRKPRQSTEPMTSVRKDSHPDAPTYGLVCQVTSVDKERPGKENSDSAQLMLRSTLSPLSVHCSPRTSRRFSTPVNPMKDFYKEILGLSSEANTEEKTQSTLDLKGSPRPFGSPVISRRFSTSSTSSDDSRRPRKTTITLPITPREPLLPNLGLKLLTKHPPIEPLNLPRAPLSPRKFSLDSRRGNEKINEQRSRRRNTIMEPPSREPRDDTSESRDVGTVSASRDHVPSSISCRDETLKMINAPSGQIASHYYPLEYGNNVLCQWRIQIKSRKGLDMRIVKLSQNATGNIEPLIAETVESLKLGHIVALPTDTIYGIAALAQSTVAVNQLYDIKERHQEKPIAICVSNVEDVKK
ncbi:hypothetical protein QZH41_005629 [Actinostola sp. cb2023]|nr:hypothetical protein QZH41_005629 [Actinostola sp. cb2023]